MTAAFDKTMDDHAPNCAGWRYHSEDGEWVDWSACDCGYPDARTPGPSPPDSTIANSTIVDVERSRPVSGFLSDAQPVAVADDLSKFNELRRRDVADPAQADILAPTTLRFEGKPSIKASPPLLKAFAALGVAAPATNDAAPATKGNAAATKASAPANDAPIPPAKSKPRKKAPQAAPEAPGATKVPDTDDVLDALENALCGHLGGIVSRHNRVTSDQGHNFLNGAEVGLKLAQQALREQRAALAAAKQALIRRNEAARRKARELVEDAAGAAATTKRGRKAKAKPDQA